VFSRRGVLRCTQYRSLRPLLSGIATVLLAVALVGAAVAGGAKRPPRAAPLPGPPHASAHKKDAASKKEKARKKRAARRRAQLRTPKAAARRRRSRTAYKHLHGAATARLARRSFEEVFERRVWRGLERHGHRIHRYLDDFTAQIDAGVGDERAITTSTLPLLTRNARGESVEVDHGLRPIGDGYAPNAALVQTHIPRSAHDPTRLGRAGIAIRSTGAHDVTGALVGNRVFYADVGGPEADTDLIVEPRELGAQFMWQLRSPAAAENHSPYPRPPPGRDA
jgi:hypothetical protein